MIAKELSGIPRQLLRSPLSKDGYRKVFENCSVSRGTEIKEEERLEPASDQKENIPIYLDGSLDPASTNSTNPETSTLVACTSSVPCSSLSATLLASSNSYLRFCPLCPFLKVGVSSCLNSGIYILLLFTLFHFYNFDNHHHC